MRYRYDTESSKQEYAWKICFSVLLWSVYFPSFFRWGSYSCESWSCLEAALFKDICEYIYIVSNAVEIIFDPHVMCVYRLGTLLPHHSKSYMPSVEPGNDVVFQDVHLG